MIKTSDRKIKQAITLLIGEGYKVVEPKPEPESEYVKALRTGVLPDIWPPIVMSREELDHFRANFMSKNNS